MAERVEIVVTAKDAASQVMRGVTSSFGKLGDMVQNLTSGQALLGLTEQFIQFGKESVDATVKYANEVRNLSMISGESAEDTSRFLQVLDDYKLSAEDATAATRAMTKQGLTPNLETLAELSDQYLAIQDPMERNEFIIKNLGRAGLQWVDVLNKGSEALLAQGDAVSEGLILNQQALDDAREYEIALDNWNDSVQELKVSIGTGLLPVMSRFVNNLNSAQRAAEIMKEKGLQLNVNTQEYRDALAQAKSEQEAATAAMIKNAEAADVATAAHEKTKEELKAEEDAMKALSKANEDYLSTVGELSDNLTDYEAKHQAIQDELDEGKITLEEAGKQWQKLADEQERATYRMILSMLHQRLAENGLDASETAFLLQQGVEWGIYSQTAVDQANAVISQVDAMIARYNNVPELVETDVVTNFISNFVGGAGFDYLNPNVGSIGGRAGGGGVKAGSMYRVNETRQEYFKPAQNGTVIPLGAGGGDGGGSINITLQPMIMSGDRSQATNVLLPMIIDGIRKAKADRII